MPLLAMCLPMTPLYQIQNSAFAFKLKLILLSLPSVLPLSLTWFWLVCLPVSKLTPPWSVYVWIPLSLKKIFFIDTITDVPHSPPTSDFFHLHPGPNHTPSSGLHNSVVYIYGLCIYVLSLLQ